jgi:prophage DNA circulation protein
MSNAHTHSINPTTELELIQRKRTALQKLIRLTSTLNRLLQGLQAVLLTGRPIADIPSKIIEQFQSLGEKLQGHSTDTLKNTLSTTDLRMQSDIKHVLQLTRMDDAELGKHIGGTGMKLVDNLNQNLDNYAGEFKKKAQTSIALRMVLKARNIVTKALKLPVPESFLEQQISVLDIRESECKKRIHRDMHSLDKDIDNMLRSEGCPDGIRQQLMQIKTSMQKNIQHFEAGKQLDEMPIMYESIELSATPQDVARVEAESQPAIAVTVEATAVVTPEKTRARGFFSRVWLWLKSPMSANWKDTAN